MAGCFRYKRDLDDMRLEWDAYIDSTLSVEEATALCEHHSHYTHHHHHPSPSPAMATRALQPRVPPQPTWDDRTHPTYTDVPCQPLLASRGSYLGQIKLSVYVNYGHITCHVIQGRHLASKHRSSCDAYVKLSLVPDESLRTRCKTDVVVDTNNPLFDEKFSFELIEEDMKKRLFISVWNKIPGKECKDEFLGCMSFGIRHIQNDKRTINGWYYLLAEDTGRRKHLQAAVKKPHLREQTTNNIPTVNQDIMWMDPYTIPIKKAKSGYGFTVSGFSPVFVCRVEKGSPADEAGLQKDDCIVRIDGLNVSRSTSDSVAKLIRSTSKQLTLEVQRPQVVTAMDVAPSVSCEPWQAVSSTPMTRAPPPVHLPGAPIPSQPPLPPARPPPPPPTASSSRWNVEVESKEPVYGNCGVFGESDPLYSTVTGPHSSGGSSCGTDPAYGMIRLPPHAAHHPPSADSASGASGSLPPRSRNSSSAGSSDMAYSICTLPRNRNPPTMVANSGCGDRAALLPRSRSSLAGPTSGVNYVTLQFPKSMSAGGLSRADVYNHYRLCHDAGDVYAPHEAVTSYGYGTYGRARHYGSAGSAGSTHSADSGSAGRSRTLPRGQKKKVHFQEFG